MSHEMFLAEDFYTKGSSVYEVIVAIARRARHIAEEQRKEMDAYLTQVGMLEEFQDEDEGMLDELQALRAEPVLQFEKPSVLALREMIADKLEIRRPEPEVRDDAGVDALEQGLEMPGKLDLSGADDDEGEAKKPDLPASFDKIDLSGE